MTPASPSVSGRLAYLDWLRFFVVLSLAPFHAAISFTAMGSVYVYDNPVRDILLTGHKPPIVGPLVLNEFTVFMDNWFMHLLFLVSGVGAAMALRKRNGAQFLRERRDRLLLPLLIGTLTVVYFQSWLRSLSFGEFSGGLPAFLPSFFTRHFEWGHFWFLAYLFVFSALLLPLFLSMRRKGEASRIISVARRVDTMPLILFPALWTGLLEALFRPGWPGYQNLVNDWANFTIYISFFFAGYVAGCIPELLQSFEKYRSAALILGVAAFLLRISVYEVTTVHDGYNAANVISQAFRGIAAYGLVAAAMGYGRHYLNRQSRMLGFARDLSLPLYLLHYAPLTAATYLLLNSGLNMWIRWFLAIAASWSFVAMFTFLARYLPVVRDFFRIEPPAVKATASADSGVPGRG